MGVSEMNGGSAVVRLTRRELLRMNTAHNEVCNGVHISDGEFQTLLGSPREAFRESLHQVWSLLDRLDGTQ